MVLNDSKIRAAKSRAKSYKLTDSQGLYLTVSTSGTKLWYFRYRFGGKESRLAFGRYPQITLAEVVTPDDEGFRARFEPTKIVGWTLEHHLNNQLARIILEKKGAYGWLHGDRPVFRSRYQTKHRPDGVITLSDVSNCCSIASNTSSRIISISRWKRSTAMFFRFIRLRSERVGVESWLIAEQPCEVYTHSMHKRGALL